MHENIISITHKKRYPNSLLCKEEGKQHPKNYSIETFHLAFTDEDISDYHHLS